MDHEGYLRQQTSSYVTHPVVGRLLSDSERDCLMAMVHELAALCHELPGSQQPYAWSLLIENRESALWMRQDLTPQQQDLIDRVQTF